MAFKIKTEKISRDYLKIWLGAVAVITLIISLMEFRLPISLWLREIGTNFILTLCIVSIIVLFDLLFNITEIRNRLTGFIKIVILFTAAGIIGGFAAWEINEVLFDFNITHPEIFLAITSVFSVVFGLLTYSYIILKERFTSALEKIHQNEINEQKLIRLNKEAELKALRAMVNPHFLFNTLNSISSLIYEDPDKAEDTIQKLSSLFRRILNAGDMEFHSLEDEINFIEDYLRIEKVRLGDKLEYKIETGENSNGVFIPSLLLQPLVENAVVHGISKLKCGGTIDISCSIGDNIVFEVSNSVSRNVSTNDARFGISGLLERLKLHFGDNYKYETDNPDGIYRVKLTLPSSKGK